jgi:ornithine cyclodeaminase
LTQAPDASLPGTSTFPYIGAEAIRDLVSMTDAIEASREGFLAASGGEVLAPLRSSISQGRVLIMPAEHKSGSGVLKVISTSKGVAETPTSGLEGIVLWVDAEGGNVAALLDVKSLTAVRTGAASGLATSLLAQEGVTKLAMIGAGSQAMDQIAGVCTTRPITDIRIFSRDYSRSLRLRDRVRVALPDVACRSAESVKEAIRDADVVCTATRATDPVFRPEDLSDHVHINAIGSFRPDMCEVPSETFRQAATVVVDQLAAALAEAGDIIQALEVGALNPSELMEIGNLLRVQSARTRGVTIFKSVGIAAQDWSIAKLIVERARAAQLLQA